MGKGGGGTPNIKWYGWSEYFGGVEIFYSGYFFAWLGLSWEFLGYSKQSERKEPWERVWRNPGRIALRIKYNQTCWGSEILHGRFWALMFGPWIFWGFDFCPHSIIPDTWNPEYPHPPLPPPLWEPLMGVQPFIFLMWKMSFVPINWQDAGQVSEKALYINFKWRLILKKCVFSAIIQRSSQTQYFTFLLPFLAHRFRFVKLHPLASSVEIKKIIVIIKIWNLLPWDLFQIRKQSNV